MRYIPGFDGLRAFAVLAVVLYHMSASFLPSGLLGVTVFFVLSGYLITGILIREWHQSKSIDLPRFWLHRIRRLFPAIVCVVLVSLVLCAFLAPDMLTKLRRDLFAALFWFTNWWYIFMDESYFAAMGAPSPVTHFWSLAIEEQFYLVWPPVLLLLFAKGVRKRAIQGGILVAAAVSVVLMMVLYVPGEDPSRVYYGTDTRAFSLLIGAWLAFAFPARRLRGEGKHGLSERAQQVIGLLGIGALVAMVCLMVLVDAFSPFMYYGGIVLVSVLTGLAIMALANPRTALARAFSLGPLVYLGRISYGIYLWHYPLLLLMNDFNSTEGTHPLMYALQMVVIVVVSMASFHFVEQPIRQGCLGRILGEVRAHATTWVTVVREHLVQVALTLGLLIGAVVACIVVPDTTTQEGSQLESGVVIPEGALETVEPAVIDDGIFSSFAGEGVMDREDLLSVLGHNPILEHLSDATLHQLAETKGTSAEAKAHDTRFIMIGDSVSVNFSEAGYGGFSEFFPYAILDAQANRRVAAGAEVYDSYADQGWDGPVVIVSLSTNGTVTSEALNGFIADIPEGKAIFVVNARAAGDNDENSNAAIAQVVADHGNVALIDWFSRSAGKDEYFDGDGTHLTATYGHDAYLGMILDALETLYK